MDLLVLFPFLQMAKIRQVQGHQQAYYNADVRYDYFEIPVVNIAGFQQVFAGQTC